MPDKETFEDATPDPEHLIKSIAEQGYSLESSIADLMDNSISAEANKIEILVDTEKVPFTLYLADDGLGMTESALKKSMQFPSDSSDNDRQLIDLGRFGLGMKTASFSQTRRFTVLSRRKGTEKYNARTWDVDLLKNKQWKLIVNSDSSIEEIVSKYKSVSKSFLNTFEDFIPNTIVVWSGLYKFEEHLEKQNRKTALDKELSEITSQHLELVFHRFMEKKICPLKIRLNNYNLKPFNPFPVWESDFRPIQDKQRSFGGDYINIEGFVCPSRSIEEDKNGNGKWTSKNKSLMDMEGIYIYRLDRIILFGGWIGLIKQSPRLQLARLKVEIGNNADHLLHLNVAKSQVIIPHDLKRGFETYIDTLRTEAIREYHNRGVTRFPNKHVKNDAFLFDKVSSNRGVLLEFNNKFPLLKSLKEELSKEELIKLNSILRMINTTINRIRHNHLDVVYRGVNSGEEPSLEDLMVVIQGLKNAGMSSKYIKNSYLSELGYDLDSFPEEVHNLLKE